MVARGLRKSAVSWASLFVLMLALSLQIALPILDNFYDVPHLAMLTIGPISATYVLYNILYRVAPEAVSLNYIPIIGTFAITTAILYLTEWPTRQARDLLAWVRGAPVVASTSKALGMAPAAAGLEFKDTRSGCRVSYCVGINSGELKPTPLTQSNCQAHARLVKTMPRDKAPRTREQWLKSMCVKFAERDNADDCVVCDGVCTPRDECEKPDVDQQIQRAKQSSARAMDAYKPDTAHESFHRTNAELFQ